MNRGICVEKGVFFFHPRSALGRYDYIQGEQGGDEGTILAGFSWVLLTESKLLISPHLEQLMDGNRQYPGRAQARPSLLFPLVLILLAATTLMTLLID